MRVRHLAPIVWVGLLALTLGGCDPSESAGPDGALAARLDQVAAAVGRGEDRVTPTRLGEWLVSGVPAVHVFDLRAREDFAAGHLQGATHLPAGEAASAAGRARLGAIPGRLVLYAEDSAPAAQVVVLLRLAGAEAYVLEGGFRAWSAHLAGEPAPAAPDPAAEARRLAQACRQSEAYAEARSRGFEPPARSLEPPTERAGGEPPSAPAAATPPVPPGAVSAAVGPPPPPPSPPAAPSFTPPLLPAEAAPAPEAAPEGGGLIVNEGC